MLDRFFAFNGLSEGMALRKEEIPVKTEIIDISTKFTAEF
jgi:hypothetical protein